MDQEQQDKCEGIDKYADIEDKKTMKRWSLSQSFTNQKLSSKSVYCNLFIQKQVNKYKYKSNENVK